MSRRHRPLVASEALSCLDWHLSLSLSLPFFFQTAKWNLTPCVWFFPCSDKMIGRGRELKFETDWEDWGEPFFSWRCRCRFGGCLISSSFDSDHPGKANCIVRSEKRTYSRGREEFAGPTEMWVRTSGSVDGGPPSIRVQRDVMWMKCVGKLEVELSFRWLSGVRCRLFIARATLVF